MAEQKQSFWNDQKSITLTKIATIAVALVSTAMVIAGPWVVDWIATVHPINLDPALAKPVLLAFGYLCAALALHMLYCLYKLLCAVERQEVFVAQNITLLRRISWCCTWAAVICVAGGIAVYLPATVVVGVLAGFMALIVRVIKNAFAQALRMKNELDLTV